MDKFKIRKLDIKKYNSENYKGVKSQENMDNILIYGEHQSGKSTTLDAICYAIFGTAIRDIRSPNNIADTFIVLENKTYELAIERKPSGDNHLLIEKNKITKEKKEIKGVKAILDKLRTHLNLNSRSFLDMHAKLLFQNDKYTLKARSSRDLVSILSYYTRLDDKNNELNDKSKQIHSLEKEMISNDVKKKILLDNVKENENLLYSSKKDITFLKELINAHESGKIDEIFEIKSTETDLFEKVKKLNSEYIGLQNEKAKLWGKFNDLSKTYDQDLKSIVRETLSVLICPVCGSHADLSKVHGDKNSDICPYCETEGYDGEIYDVLSEKIKESNEELPKLKKLIDEVDKKINDNRKLVKEYQNQLGNIELLLNNRIISAVGKYTSSSDQAYLDHIEKAKERYEIGKMELINAESEIKECKEKIIKLDEENEDLREKIDNNLKMQHEIESELNQELIDNFLAIFNNYYAELTGYKKKELSYDKNFRLIGGTPSKPEYYTLNSDELSDAERRCVDLALLITFLDLDNEYNTSNVGFVILDEPAEGLIDDPALPAVIHHKNNMLKLMKDKIDNKKSQFVILTADDTYNKILNLDEVRINFYNLDKWGVYNG